MASGAGCALPIQLWDCAEITLVEVFEFPAVTLVLAVSIFSYPSLSDTCAGRVEVRLAAVTVKDRLRDPDPLFERLFERLDRLEILLLQQRVETKTMKNSVGIFRGCDVCWHSSARNCTSL